VISHQVSTSASPSSWPWCSRTGGLPGGRRLRQRPPPEECWSLEHHRRSRGRLSRPHSRAHERPGGCGCACL